MDFSNIFSLLSNINNKTNDNVKNDSNILNNNLPNKNNANSNSYPYGNFPYNYTIEGQKKLRESIIKTNSYNFSQVENYDLQNLPDNTQNLNQSNNYNNTQNNSNNNTLNQLLPLITGLLSTKTQKDNNIFTKLLPLLSGGNIDISNILKETQKTEPYNSRGAYTKK